MTGRTEGAVQNTATGTGWTPLVSSILGQNQVQPGFQNVNTIQGNTSAWKPNAMMYNSGLGAKGGSAPVQGVTQVSPAVQQQMGTVQPPAQSSTQPIMMIPEGSNIPLAQRPTPTPPTGVSNPYTQQNAQPYQPTPQMQQQQQQMQQYYQMAQQIMMQQLMQQAMMRYMYGGGMGSYGMNPYAYGGMGYGAGAMLGGY